MNNTIKAAVVVFVIGLVGVVSSFWNLQYDREEIARAVRAQRALEETQPLDPTPYYWAIGISCAAVLSSFIILGIGLAIAKKQ